VAAGFIPQDVLAATIEALDDDPSTAGRGTLDDPPTN
jgi:hypothetical protein